MPDTQLPPNVSELERRLGLPVGDLIGEDKARAEDALTDATTTALAEVPRNIANLWLADAPAIVRLVILKAARREYENPQGLETESLGEHSIAGMETSGVYLTPREISQIKRAATGRLGGFTGTIRTPSAY